MEIPVPTSELTYQRLRKQTCGCWGEGIVREFGKVVYTPHCYIKMDYCRAHGILLSRMWRPGQEGSLEENGHVCLWLSPFTVHLQLLHVVNGLYPDAK